MPFKVEVGPRQIAIHYGQTVLITEPDAQIHWPSERGLYFLVPHRPWMKPFGDAASRVFWRRRWQRGRFVYGAHKPVF